MNFLAHIALSGNREGIILGNFSGDFIKGKLTLERTNNWSDDFLIGVHLHRYIDTFTDTHPTVREAKKLLALSHPKVAGVALDIYFDYFLANHFSEYYSESLSYFVSKTYNLLYQNRQMIPEAMRPMADALIRHNWLYNYREIAGIKRSFEGIANRFEFMAAIRGAEIELQRNFAHYETTFLTFYPELKTASQLFIAENKLK